MAENDRRCAEITSRQIPVITTPSLSQANPANGSPMGTNQFAGRLCRGALQAAAKPPPDGKPEDLGRRRTDAGAARPGIPEPPRSGLPEADEDAGGQRQRRGFGETAAKVLLAAVCVVIVIAVQIERQRTEKIAASPLLSPAPTAEPDIIKLPGYSPGLPKEPEAALTTALDDLDSAIERRTESPEELLKTVSRPGENCALAWTSRLPSLVFGKKPIGPNSLAAELEGCAQAIARLPR
jgi:hypothetical protein